MAWCHRLLSPLVSFMLAGCAAIAPDAPLADHHQHLLRAETIAAITTGPARPAPIEADDLVRMLDAAGIRRAVVLSMAYTLGSPSRAFSDEYERVKTENDWTAAQAAAHPARLVAFCGVNPLKDYAIPEIARCANLLRATGLKLHIGNSDVQLENPEHAARLQAVFAAANAHRMAIVVHMRASVSRRRAYGAEQAKVFLEQLLPNAPDVVVQVAHLAATGPGYDDPPAREALDVFVQAIERKDARVRNLWFDAAGLVREGMTAEEGARLAADIRRVGIARVLFGSDAAVPPNFAPREAWKVFRATIPLEVREMDRLATNVAPYLR